MEAKQLQERRQVRLRHRELTERLRKIEEQIEQLPVGDEQVFEFCIKADLIAIEIRQLEAQNLNAVMRLLTAQEAAEVLGVNDSRIRQLILAGQLPATKQGGHWILSEVDVYSYKINRGVKKHGKGN